MTVFSKKSHEGHIMVDHRASPGIPPELAIKLGYKPEDVGEGKLFETISYGCIHCGTCYMKNPYRWRPREHCFTCNRDICDDCYNESKLPGYVHKTFLDKAEDKARAEQLADFLRGGRPVVSTPSPLQGTTVNSPQSPPPLILTGE